MESLFQVIRNTYMHFFSCFGIYVPNFNIDKPTKVEMAIPEKRHLGITVPKWENSTLRNLITFDRAGLLRGRGFKNALYKWLSV